MTMNLTAELKQEARRLGFDQIGVCPAVTPTGIHRFYEWLAAGYSGEMKYIGERAKAYEHPQHVLDGVRSLVMLTMNYRTSPAPTAEPLTGQVSRYAWGSRDYHDTIHARLKKLVAFLGETAPAAKARGVVDTAPLLERDFARLAGLGWIGKHTLLIHPERGSWFFLAALLTDIELEYDVPFTLDHCGTCRACLDACPTQAFPQPYVLDATRCISYLTIELRESIPSSLRNLIGNWAFGCDVCQEVCPWNRHSQLSTETDFTPRSDLRPLNLPGLFALNDETFRELFRKTPLWRSKRKGLLRNAAIVLGNQRDEQAVDALALGLQDIEPIVRATCAWALGQVGTPAALNALRKRSADADSSVQAEIKQALDQSE